MPQFVHRSGRAELCDRTAVSVAGAGSEGRAVPLFSLPWTTRDAPSHSSVAWPEHLNFFGLFRSSCSNRTWRFVAVTFCSWKNCRTLLLSSFCRCLSCHLPLLMPLQHHARQAAAVWGGAVSVTILHLKNWSQMFHYNFVALQQ